MRYAAVFALTATLLAACNPTPENKAPTVSLVATPLTLAPGASSTLTATVVKGTGDVKKVEFFEGTNLISSDDTAPYTATYTTTATTALGDKSLTAKVTDSNSLSGTSTAVKVTVATPIAPTGTLTTPATALVGLEVTLSATATAATGANIASVEFFDGTTSLGKATRLLTASSTPSPPPGPRASPPRLPTIRGEFLPLQHLPPPWGIPLECARSTPPPMLLESMSSSTISKQ